MEELPEEDLRRRQHTFDGQAHGNDDGGPMKLSPSFRQPGDEDHKSVNYSAMPSADHSAYPSGHPSSSITVSREVGRVVEVGQNLEVLHPDNSSLGEEQSTIIQKKSASSLVPKKAIRPALQLELLPDTSPTQDLPDDFQIEMNPEQMAAQGTGDLMGYRTGEIEDDQDEYSTNQRYAYLNEVDIDQHMLAEQQEKNASELQKLRENIMKNQSNYDHFLIQEEEDLTGQYESGLTGGQRRDSAATPRDHSATSLTAAQHNLPEGIEQEGLDPTPMDPQEKDILVDRASIPLKKAKTGKDEQLESQMPAYNNLRLPAETSNNSTGLNEIDMALTPSAIPGGELESQVQSKAPTQSGIPTGGGVTPSGRQGRPPPSSGQVDSSTSQAKSSPPQGAVWDAKQATTRDEKRSGMVRNASRSIRELEAEILKVDNDLVAIQNHNEDDHVIRYEHDEDEFANVADFEKEFTSKISQKSSCINHDFLLEQIGLKSEKPLSPVKPEVPNHTAAAQEQAQAGRPPSSNGKQETGKLSKGQPVVQSKFTRQFYEPPPQYSTNSDPPRSTFLEVPVKFGSKTHLVQIDEGESVEEITDRLVVENPQVLRFLPDYEKERIISNLQNDLFQKIITKLQDKKKNNTLTAYDAPAEIQDARKGDRNQTAIGSSLPVSARGVENPTGTANDSASVTVFGAIGASGAETGRGMGTFTQNIPTLGPAVNADLQVIGQVGSDEDQSENLNDDSDNEEVAPMSSHSPLADKKSNIRNGSEVFKLKSSQRSASRHKSKESDRSHSYSLHTNSQQMTFHQPHIFHHQSEANPTSALQTNKFGQHALAQLHSETISQSNYSLTNPGGQVNHHGLPQQIHQHGTHYSASSHNQTLRNKLDHPGSMHPANQRQRRKDKSPDDPSSRLTTQNNHPVETSIENEDDDISRREGPQTPMTPLNQQQLLADDPPRYQPMDNLLHIEEQKGVSHEGTDRQNTDRQYDHYDQPLESKRSRSRSPLNIGDRLHQQALVMREHKERLRIQYEREQLLKEAEEASFKPKIYTHPSKQKVRPPGTKTEDALMMHKKMKDQNLERLKQEREDQILKDCNNFKPKVNKKSEQIEKRRIQERSASHNGDQSFLSGITSILGSQPRPANNDVPSNMFMARRDSSDGAGAENLTNGSAELDDDISPNRTYNHHHQPNKLSRFDELYMRGLQSKVKKNNMIIQKNSAENIDEECTFQPRLYTNVSRSWNNLKDAHPTRGDAISIQNLSPGINRNTQITIIDNKVHYQDDISYSKSQQQSRTHSKTHSKQPSGEVWERLGQRVKDYPSKMKEKLKPEDLKKKVNPKTGQLMFQPKLFTKSKKSIDRFFDKLSTPINTIGGGNVNIRSNHTIMHQNQEVSRSVSALATKPLSLQASIDFGDKLYQNGITKLAQRQNRLDQEVKMKKKEIELESNRIKISDKSKLIVEQKMKQQLASIFTLFDADDKDGKISSDHIDLEKVPAEILIIFKPLLIEMEQFNESLDREEFIESSYVLLQTLTVDKKNYILNFDKQHRPKIKEPKFTPQISEASKRLAEKSYTKKFSQSRPFSKSKGDLLKRFEILQKEHEDKIIRLAAEKQMKEIEGCTFVPKLNKHKSDTAVRVYGSQNRNNKSLKRLKRGAYLEPAEELFRVEDELGQDWDKNLRNTNRIDEEYFRNHAEGLAPEPEILNIQQTNMIEFAYPHGSFAAGSDQQPPYEPIGQQQHMQPAMNSVASPEKQGREEILSQLYQFAKAGPLYSQGGGSTAGFQGHSSQAMGSVGQQSIAHGSQAFGSLGNSASLQQLQGTAAQTQANPPLPFMSSQHMAAASKGPQPQPLQQMADRPGNDGQNPASRVGPGEQKKRSQLNGRRALGVSQSLSVLNNNGAQPPSSSQTDAPLDSGPQSYRGPHLAPTSAAGGTSTQGGGRTIRTRIVRAGQTESIGAPGTGVGSGRPARNPFKK